MVGGQDCVSVLAGHQDQPEQAPLSPQPSPISATFAFLQARVSFPSRVAPGCALGPFLAHCRGGGRSCGGRAQHLARAVSLLCAAMSLLDERRVGFVSTGSSRRLGWSWAVGQRSLL